MILSTLCYIQKEDQWLMLHRTKKKADPNSGKWIGVGGKLEPNESPDECLVREVREETGLTLTEYRPRGVITFVSDQWETEYLFLYTANGFTGQVLDCPEGELAWVPISQVPNLPLWEGDRAFLPKIAQEGPYFTMKLVYQGDRLVECREGSGGR